VSAYFLDRASPGQKSSPKASILQLDNNSAISAPLREIFFAENKKTRRFAAGAVRDVGKMYRATVTVSSIPTMRNYYTKRLSALVFSKPAQFCCAPGFIFSRR
jgi:hypothetical protein